MESRTRMSRIAYGGACIFAGLAVLILIMRPAPRTTPDHPGRTPRLRGDSLIEPCRGRRCRCHIRTRHSIVTSTHDEHGRHLTDPVASSGHEADLSTEGGLREALGRFEGAYQDLYWDLHRFR